MPLTMSIPVAQLLKEGTACAHREAEEVLAPRLASISSYDDYASILRMFYGFFRPLETILTQHISPVILPDINERRNSLFIVADLKSIGHSTERLRICDRLPKINSSLAALGAMYVLEGSTLGGRMIGRMLMNNSSVQFNVSNLNFFNGYKEDTGKKWTSFLSVINQHGEGAEVIVEAANSTFHSLTLWMKKTL